MKKIYYLLIVILTVGCTKNDFGKEIAELKNEVSILRGQIGTLQKTTDSLNNELKLTKSQIIVINGKIDSIYKKIDLVNTQISSLTSDLNSKISALSSQTTTQQEETNKLILDLIKQITTLQKELSDLTKQINTERLNQIQLNGFEIVSVDPRLKSNKKGVITVPVVIVNYIPTSDGKYLDRWRTFNSNVIWDDIHKLTMTRVNEKILKEKIIDKYSIEEGTRFRDYGKNVTKPYVDIDVVAYINVYDLKLIKVGTRMVDTTMNDSDDGINNPVAIDWHKIDFNELFERINLKNYVNNLNTKEVWFTSFTKESGVYSYNVAETSMSPSLTSVDPVNISNGGMNITDLPRYNKTYVVYGSNGWRGVDTDLHVRGHQIERQLDYLSIIDRSNTYYGYYAKNRNTIGGFTHTPVNTTTQYDYNNTSSVSSDITTWKPSGGVSVNTNNLSWLNQTYTFSNEMVAPNTYATGNVDWNKNAEVKWFIYWWQSIPGLNNSITDGNKTVNNWWDLYYNWDDAIKNKTKLVY
jgi:uncharacterized protein YoxC